MAMASDNNQQQPGSPQAPSTGGAYQQQAPTYIIIPSNQLSGNVNASSVAATGSPNGTYSSGTPVRVVNQAGQRKLSFLYSEFWTWQIVLLKAEKLSQFSTITFSDSSATFDAFDNFYVP